MNQDDNGQANNPTNETQVPSEPAVQPTKQPIESTPVPPIMPAHEPRGPKRKMTVIIACAVVLLVLIGGLAYALTKAYPENKNPSTHTTAPSGEEKHETMSAAEHIVGELKTKVSGEQQQIDATTEQGGTGQADGIVYASATYQAGDQKFAVYPSVPYGFGTSSSAEVALSDITAIKSYLKEHDFSETAEGSGIFTSKDVVCAAQLFNENFGGHVGIGLSCGDIDDYIKKYQAALPFYTAYVASKPESTEDLALSAPVIKDGANGYKNAHVNIGPSDRSIGGGFAALFYLAPNTDKWTFFIGTQSDLDCALFTTDTLKKAFNGQRCIILSTGEESAVTSE